MIISETDYIEHYGTKGMRWGVRKAHRNAISTWKKTSLGSPGTKQANAKSAVAQRAEKKGRSVQQQVAKERKRRETVNKLETAAILTLGGMALVGIMRSRGMTKARNAPIRPLNLPKFDPTFMKIPVANIPAIPMPPVGGWNVRGKPGPIPQPRVGGWR